MLLCVERDAGLVTDERAMLSHLQLMMSGDHLGGSDSDDSDDSDDDLSALTLMM